MNISGKKAIIFGGTSGIGLSTVKMLSEKGASKILAAKVEILKRLVKFLIMSIWLSLMFWMRMVLKHFLINRESLIF